MSKAIATQAVQNRKQIARLKAKARLRRVVVAVPVVVVGAAAYFKEKDRKQWLADNPGKSSLDYGCAIGSVTVEVLDEVLAELPVQVSLPSFAIPECKK